MDPTISLDLLRNLPKGTPLHTVEPDVGRIAYELWEGKRFLNGVSEERAGQMHADVLRAMEIASYHKLAGLSPLEAPQAILDRNTLDDIENIRSVTAVMAHGDYFESGPLWRAADFEPGPE